MVVPIYNVEDYLVSCLESLADQTFSDLEVLLVDDGSPDRSGEIADEFAQGRPGWRVLHVENGGLGRARNIGLDAAGTEFVTFVDSDDVVPRDAYELMMHAIEGSGSDIVSGGVLRYDGARTRPSGLHRRAVPETRIGTVSVGQAVSVSSDSGGAAIAGTVSFVSAQAEFTPNTVQTAEQRAKLVYEVRVTISDSSGTLKPGMPVDVTLR